jgi:Tol biopolymer transport system component
MTAMGMILGTAAYMSPEQAKGRVVDKRADIWAFGVVLYEMLTGRRAFQGDDVSDLLVAVLSKDVDLTALPAGTPRSIVTLIQRCLVRDPKQRLRDIGDARFALDERAEPGAGASDSASPRVVNRTPERFAWAALVIVAAVLTPLTMKWFAAAAPEPVVSRFELPLPVKASLFNRLEISPDGRQIAVVVAGDDGINRISIRPMDATMFRVLPGTEDASYPFWSPDSRSIAFFSHDTLKKIAVAGGPPTTLCPALRGRGGTWNSAGVVLFSSSINNAEHLQQVAEGGGTPALVASLTLAGTSSIQRWPHFLPDGRHFLFFASARKAETDGVYVGSFGETGATRLVEGFTEARYSDGMLFFVRDTTLLAQPFDAVRRVLGPADPVVVSSVSPGGNEGAQAFSVSEGGTLVARPMAVASEFQLKWFDRGGRWVADLGVPASQLGPRISRDGLRVVTPTVPVLGRPGGGALWTTDVKSGRSQRLTFVDGGYGTAVWSPDATAVFFGMGTGATGISDLFRQPTNGGASQEALLVDRAHKNPVDVSLDGRYLAYVRAPTQSTTEVWVLSLADRKPSLYVKQGARARLSPVGGWAAYAGNESGRFEIFLQSFPTPGTKFQITTGGGDAPVWSRDGREIFYHAGGKLMAVSVSMTAGTPTIGQATTLFNLPVNLQGSNDYDVSPDGRFLFAVPVENQTPTALVTLNWKAGLKK